MDLVIKQYIDRTETVSSSFIDVLYQLTKPDSSTGQPAANAVFVGRLQTPAAYEDAVNFLNTHFSSEQDNGSDFQITVLNNNYYIRFADQEVVNALISAGVMQEGGGLTTSQAAATNLGTIFKNNTDIESFDEFKYFISPGKTLSQQAFYNCSSLERIDLSNCRSYPNEAFSNLTNLEYTGGAGSPQGVIIIPEGTTSIGGWNNFSKCNKITSVILPDSLTYINGNNFQNMAALTEITVGTGMTTWVRGNFGNCPNFSKVNIKDLDAWLNITFESTGDAETPLAVARHLYLNGIEVTSVDFTGKAMIKDKVLWGCLGLTSVVLPSTITSIGNSAFRSCDNLVIPDLNLPNLTILGSYAFRGTKLQAISSLGNIAALSQGCFYDCTQLVNAIIPSTSTVIPNECFMNCLSLTSVDLPSSVTTIGDRAFYDCRNLATIDITNVTTLGDSAFGRCGSLSRFNGPNSTVGEIYLPNLTGDMHNAFVNLSQYAPAQIIYNITSLGTITVIGQWCFSTMRIESIHLPATLTKIGPNAFTNCPYVHDIYWEGTMDQWVNINFEGGGSNPCGINSVNFYVNGTPPTSYAFPSGTTEIKKFALEGVKGLTSVTIPNSVTSIGQSAFRNCSGLTSITIPNSVTSIGGQAFYGCSGLTSITIPNSVTSIGGGAFQNCSGLTSLTIPDSVTSLGGGSIIAGCTSLQSLTLGNGLTNIPTGAFKDANYIQSLVIPDSVVTIGDEAFGKYTVATSLTLGSSLTTIGEIAFYRWKALTSLVIPVNVASIGAKAFTGCSQLQSVTVRATTPPTMGSNVFESCHSNLVIYVPSGSVSAYQSALGWSTYASRIQAIPT